MSPSHSSSPAATRLFLAQAGRLLQEGWLPRLLGEDSREDSPPEDYLGLALRCLLFEELASGRMRLQRHASLLEARRDWAPYEPDYLIHQSGTNARAIVEVDSYAFHRRDRAEHQYELRRERALSRGGLPVLRFAGAEARWHPWRCALEVVEFLTTVWREFAPVRIPPEVLRLTRTLAASRLPEDPSPALPATPSTLAAGAAMPAGPMDPEWAEIARRIVALPRVVPAHTARKREYRARYPRSDEPWTSEEDGYLRRLAPCILDRQVLAQILGRPRNAVGIRISQLAAMDAEEGGGTA